ncbi:helix-turn-helix transcriptional regulator [Virgisporangium ochraceum]|uniref:Transcriptional regulator n=1 Tax=Virgisporangium ochraceum TaxID=65505 RepID=A0A8J3ZTW2_9ACTN|nr:helix-turn-helix transcriptional regulator [Virgisporangium ochraceum]GIJ67973.1 transcriptional regulator [Virgisporangium ochraceum]
MEIDECAVGQRIASHRVRRGLTQAELAGLVGISLSMMKKIESGDRLVTRFSQLIQFAEALRIKDLRELTGVPLSLLPDGRRGHPATNAVYAAVMQRHPPVGEVLRPALLAERVERTWQAWQTASAFRYDMVGQALPALVTDVEAALWQSTGDERRSILRLSSTLYQLVRTWTKRVGEYELSLVAADRAVTYALDADDPDLAGASAWNLAMILSAQGRTEQARAVLHRAIEELKPRLDGCDPARLAVFGGLHLLAATEAARDDHIAEASRLLDVADSIAARTGETNHHRMVFGPTNVALHRVSAAVELGRTIEALEITEQVAIGNSPAVERRLTFRLDAARCYVRKNEDVAAIHMIERIHRESPEELRYSSVVRETLRQLWGRRKPATEAELRPLVAAANLTT